MRRDPSEGGDSVVWMDGVRQAQGKSTKQVDSLREHKHDQALEGMKDTLAQEREASLAVHLPFDEL